MFRHAVTVFALLVFISSSRAADVTNTDPQRDFQVKQWSGAFDTKASSSGKRERPGNGVETYSSSITVEGRFKLTPFVDKRNGPDPVWRGKGDARITVSGKSTAVYPAEVVYSTWVGDYVDTINVEVSNIDVKAGTYQLAIIRDLWQDQPHKGKAIEHKEVRVTRDGTFRRTEMSPGHSWADDGGAGFGRESPLPKEGFVIAGAMTNKNDDFLSEGGSQWKTKWEIRPVDPEFQEPLKAIPGGPYKIERGGTVNLDGWKSTGKIRSYKWTFEPADSKSTIPFNAASSKAGERVPVVALAPFKATLTVSDGTKEDSASLVVEVVARDFKTPFVHRKGDTPHPVSTPPAYVKGHDMRFAGGENVCALDDYNAKDSIHVLHPNAKAGSWKDNGYVTKKVQDPGGPFDGLWYADDYSLRVERQVHVNKWLLPEARRGPVRNTEPFYKANKALEGHDPDAYLAAIRKHELLHSELMEKALAKNDPGPKVETAIFKEESELKSVADKEIQTSEDTLGKASEDPLPSVGFKGKVAFPDIDTGRYITVELEF
jgi:hypothetical protein